MREDIMRNRFRVVLLVVIALAAVTSMPIEAGNKEHQQMMADLRILQQQTQILEAQLSALTEMLKSVNSRLDGQADESRRAFADQKSLVGGVAGDVRVVREKVDETNVRLGSLSQEVEAVRVSQTHAEVQPAGAPPADVPPTGGAASVTATQALAVAPPASPGMSPQRMFDSALADYYAGRWSLAITAFEIYIKTFPKSDLVDDAQYYIGETHYSAGQFREAVTDYDSVIASYPASRTLPDVYYKRGLALKSLGQAQEARESLEFVAKNYPDSDAGRMAKQALGRMGPIRKSDLHRFGYRVERSESAPSLGMIESDGRWTTFA